MLRWVRDQVVEGFIDRATPTKSSPRPSRHAGACMSAAREPGRGRFFPPARDLGLLPSPSILGKGKGRSCPSKSRSPSISKSLALGQQQHALNLHSSAASLRYDHLMWHARMVCMHI
jgi:hypothetical protein